MKTQYGLKAVIGAVLISGAAMAQQPPAAPGRQLAPGASQGGAGAMRGLRGAQMQRGGPQGAPGGQPMQRGAQCPMGGAQCPMGGAQMQRGRGGLGSEIGGYPFLNPERLKAAGVKEEQLAALKAFTDEQEIKRIDLQAEVDKAQLGLKQVMSHEGADEKAALAAFDRVSKARAEAARQGISAKFKVREILGPEVAGKLREMGPPQGAGPRRPGAQGGAPAGVPEQR